MGKNYKSKNKSNNYSDNTDIPFLLPPNRSQNWRSTFSEFREALKNRVLSEIPLVYTIISDEEFPRFAHSIDHHFFKTYWPYLRPDKKEFIKKLGMTENEIRLILI